MENKLICKYRFKFYLNASHSITMNGVKGQVHPHTWEFVLDILVPRKEFQEFYTYEKVVEEFFATYQNQVLNERDPFQTVDPTLENLVYYFGAKIREIIRTPGGELMCIEGSETPTRSYIISYERESEYVTNVNQLEEGALSQVLDSLLDDIVSEGEQHEE